MEVSPARRLILTVAALMAVFDIVALLPGNPVIESVGSFFVVVAVQALLIWGLYQRQSGVAWLLVVLLSGWYAASTVLVGGPYETTWVISGLLAAMQVALIFTPPVLAYVFGRDRPAH